MWKVHHTVSNKIRILYYLHLYPDWPDGGGYQDFDTMWEYSNVLENMYKLGMDGSRESRVEYLLGLIRMEACPGG